METLAIFGTYPHQLQLVKNEEKFFLRDNDYNKTEITGAVAEQLFHGYNNLHAARRECRFENHGAEIGHFNSLYRKAVYLYNGLTDEFICDMCMHNRTCTNLERPVQFPLMDADGAPDDYCAQFIDKDSDYIECTCELCASQG